MKQKSAKNEDSSLCYDVTITHQNFKNLVIFSCDIDYKSRTDVSRNVISLIINQHKRASLPCAARRTLCIRRRRPLGA